MTLYKNTMVLAASLGILALPAFALARESHAEVDLDAQTSIQVAHPALTSGVLFGGNGTVVVNGAKVNTVGSTTLTAQSAVGTSVFNWIVDTDASTTIKEAGTKSGTISDIAVGDTISFGGVLASVNGTFTVTAKRILDWTRPAVAATTTASTTVSRKDNGKHVGWFKNWFSGFFPGKANVQKDK